MLKVRCKGCLDVLTAGAEKIYCSCGNIFCDPVVGENFNAGWIKPGTYDESMELLNEDGSPFGPTQEVATDMDLQSVIE